MNWRGNKTWGKWSARGGTIETMESLNWKHSSRNVGRDLGSRSPKSPEPTRMVHTCAISAPGRLQPKPFWGMIAGPGLAWHHAVASCWTA